MRCIAIQNFERYIIKTFVTMRNEERAEQDQAFIYDEHFGHQIRFMSSKSKSFECLNGFWLRLNDDILQLTLINMSHDHVWAEVNEGKGLMQSSSTSSLVYVTDEVWAQYLKQPYW